MLALTEKQALIQALGQVVFDEVKAAIAPLQDRVAQLEKALGDLSIVPKETPLGEARSDENPPAVDEEFLRQYVIGALEAYEQSRPPVRDGKDGADGRDGADGKSLCLDDIRTCVNDLVDEAVGNLPLPVHCVSWLVDRAGHLHVTCSDGTVHDVGQVVGRDGKDGEPGPAGAPGKDGRDGIDGLGIEQIDYDGERTFRLANEKIDRSFMLPFPIDRGLWKPGRMYERGDVVSSDGSAYHAQESTDKEPGTLGSGWRLMVKQGRRGRDGRDLTGK